MGEARGGPRPQSSGSLQLAEAARKSDWKLLNEDKGPLSFLLSLGSMVKRRVTQQREKNPSNKKGRSRKKIQHWL